jgi:hypothetical protein
VRCELEESDEKTCLRLPGAGLLLSCCILQHLARTNWTPSTLQASALIGVFQEVLHNLECLQDGYMVRWPHLILDFPLNPSEALSSRSGQGTVDMKISSGNFIYQHYHTRDKVYCKTA